MSLSFDVGRDLPLIVGVEKGTPAAEAGIQVQRALNVCMCRTGCMRVCLDTCPMTPARLQQMYCYVPLTSSWNVNVEGGGRRRLISYLAVMGIARLI